MSKRYIYTMVKTPANSIHLRTRAEWRMWLKQNHPRAEGVWIVNAKKPATRAKRVEETARIAAENIRANPWRP